MGLRYSDQGMNALYRDYRGKRYAAVRNKWEGWYDNTYNQGHEDQSWIELRAIAIREFLERFVALSDYHIVDVGGDTGQISTLLGAKSVEVVEISDRNAEIETHSLGMEENVAKHNGLEIAVLAHVLEHVSDPIATLKSLLDVYPIVYVELPAGVPQSSRARRSLSLTGLKLIASKMPLVWRSLSRPSAGRIKPAEVLRCSEHLTFFSKGGLIELAVLLGGHVIVENREIIAPGSFDDKVTIIQAVFSQAPLGPNFDN